MSTILDALRTLQRERESRLGPDAQDSLLQAEAPSLPRRSRTPLIASGGALLIAVPAALLFGLRDGSDPPGATDGPPATARAVAASPPAPAPAPASAFPVRPPLRAGIAPSEAEREVPPSVPEARAIPEAPVIPAPAAELQPPPALASARELESPVAGSLAAARRDAPAGPSAAPATSSHAAAHAAPPSPARVIRSPKSVSAKSERPPARARSAVARVKAREAPAEEGLESPHLSVRQIRWHPDPERRSARVVREDGSFAVVREGDIVEGALVRRIATDSIELSIGSERRRLALSR